MKTVIRKYWLAAIGVLVFAVSAAVLSARPMFRWDLRENALYPNPDSPVVSFVSDDAGVLKYGNDRQDGDFGEAEGTLYSTLGSLQFGVYMLHVEYSTSYDTSDISRDNLPICNLTLTGGRSSKEYITEAALLYDYKSYSDVPIYVTSPIGTSDVTLNVNYSGCGYCEIRSIRIEEDPLWKVGFLLLELLVLAGICLWHYRFRYAEPEQKVKGLVLAALVVFASYPALLGGVELMISRDRIWDIILTALLPLQTKSGTGISLRCISRMWPTDTVMSPS